jgi:hypothetical protein
MAVQLLLGTANLIFWDGYTEFGMLLAGIASTIARGLFVVSHGAALILTRHRSTARGVPED